MLSFISKFFDGNSREIERLKPIVAAVNAHEEQIAKLKDADLPGKTAELKNGSPVARISTT